MLFELLDVFPLFLDSCFSDVSSTFPQPTASKCSVSRWKQRVWIVCAFVHVRFDGVIVLTGRRSDLSHRAFGFLQPSRSWIREPPTVLFLTLHVNPSSIFKCSRFSDAADTQQSWMSGWHDAGSMCETYWWLRSCFWQWFTSCWPLTPNGTEQSQEDQLESDVSTSWNFVLLHLKNKRLLITFSSNKSRLIAQKLQKFRNITNKPWRPNSAASDGSVYSSSS